MKIPKILHIISNALQKKNASAVIVGGSVRDYFLKLPSKDYDIEVYGLETLEQLESTLTPYGSVNLVGKSFGVLKFTYAEEVYDFSFPRTELKVGEGHRGFDVDVNGSLDFETAAKRRDFTINALGYDIETKSFIDPFDGLADIKAMRLQHIDDDTFMEDPLRVYRAVQFSARFGFALAKDTFRLCKQMVEKNMLDVLAKERVYSEWKKLLLKSKKSSVGFELMKELGILERYFPELHALVGILQSPKWHPEGDVWVHTMMTLDSMSEQLAVRSGQWSDKQKLKFLFAILCHDLGKLSTTTIDEEGHIRSIGHERAGLEPAKSLMHRLTDEHDFIKSLLPLVEHHLKPSQLYAAKSKASAIRRLATKVNIEELVMVAKADFLGRTTKEALNGEYEAGKWLMREASQLKVKTKPIEHFIQGRDLINLGLEPSPMFKTIIDEVYELQLDGKINSIEEALAWVREHYIKGTSTNIAMHKIFIQTYQSPVGEMLLGSYNNKLCIADWKHRKMRKTIDSRIQKGLKATYVEQSSEVIEETIKQIKEYFEGVRKNFDVPLLMVGTDFQRSVWEGLMNISYGTTTSYLDLAKSIDNEKAVRAVASANGANAISIMIPCHRIIGSNGDLVGYAGGLDVKKKLLELESNLFSHTQ